jgi:hypothetical protein
MDESPRSGSEDEGDTDSEVGVSGTTHKARKRTEKGGVVSVCKTWKRHPTKERCTYESQMRVGTVGMLSEWIGWGLVE